MSRALRSDEVAHLTPEQRWYLNWISWCLDARQRIADGYNPSITEAAYFQQQVEQQDRRDRETACSQSYGDEDAF